MFYNEVKEFAQTLEIQKNYGIWEGNMVMNILQMHTCIERENKYENYPNLAKVVKVIAQCENPHRVLHTVLAMTKDSINNFSDSN